MGDGSVSGRREAGRKIKEKLFGTAPAAARGPSDLLAPDLGELSDDALWGGVWARPGLDLPTKSLCTITALLALERYPYAKQHMVGARNIGISLETLTAAIVQLTFYVGLPVVHSGLALAAEVYGVDGAWGTPTPPEGARE